MYAVRRQLICGYDAITFVFDEPLDLHLWDGWQPFADGWSNEPDASSHHWTGLVRASSPAVPFEHNAEHRVAAQPARTQLGLDAAYRRTSGGSPEHGIGRSQEAVSQTHAKRASA